MLPNSDISYLEERLLDSAGRLRILPYAALADVPQAHLSLFCVEHGVYCVPTQELVDWLRAEIGGQECIEIGSGNGVLAAALRIPATDSRMQERPEMIAYYRSLQQATVSYGPNVEELDAVAAVKHYKPHSVLAAWVTHRYNPSAHELGGSMYGVNELEVFSAVRRYILVGNQRVHQHKPLLAYPHTSFKAPWLLSRALDPEQNVIWVWEG